VPQSALPHLKWLKEPDYAHSYYVDMTPTVVEIKDPSKTEAQGGPWRTIVLGSMRFGGRAIEVGSPPRYSWSEVFALDVTEPDKEPIVLWRFSHPRMGLIVARPSVARNNSGGDGWYVLVGSGPTYDQYDALKNAAIPASEGPRAYAGHSNQSARLFVFDALKGPASGVKVIDTKRPKSFFASLHVVGAPRSGVKKDPSTGEITWNNDLAYLGLNQSAPGNVPLCLESPKHSGPYLSPSVPTDLCPKGKNGQSDGTFDKGGVWRLSMKGPVSGWEAGLKVLIDADKPVSAPVNTTFDAQGRLWVLFGTGRYYSDEDSLPCLGAANAKDCRINHVNYILGVKEPVNPVTKELSYAEVKMDDLIDVSNVVVYPSGAIASKDKAGQLQSVAIGGLSLARYGDLASLIASPSSAGYKRALKTATSEHVGAPDDPLDAKGQGWWQKMRYEGVIEQAAVAPFGPKESVMSLASFMPEAGGCGSYGSSFGIMIDTFSGLPKPVFGSQGLMGDNQFQLAGQDELAGEKPVSDHVSAVTGKSSAPVFVLTGGNESKRGQFEIVNADGTVTIFRLPEDRTLKGGIVSWREVLDLTTLVQ
jgi:hypothetical protein